MSPGNTSDLIERVDLDNPEPDIDQGNTQDMRPAPDMSPEPPSDMPGAFDMTGEDLGADMATADMSAPVLVDDALLISPTMRLEGACGEVLAVDVVMENSGTTTWTRDENYRLNVRENAGLAVRNNARLDQSERVLPGTRHTFGIELSLPSQAGNISTAWMLTSDRGDFGPRVQIDVEVRCDMPLPEPPPPVLSQVVWLHHDVSQWSVTATLSPVTFTSNQICLPYDKADVWPVDPSQVVANPWIFIYHRQEQRWYGATWEWLRPGQTCKFLHAVAGDHIKQPPFDAASGWVPTSGEVYYFMVSGLARLSERNVMERSNLVRVVWP